ncbi:hypothetical protein Ahy_B08g093831 [Arachis hypogaea]|uniref:U-box domain-containing protein n=1 Tax=Arachis hypogaea TaxID=3818 RepID=A0A444Y713_ARAHY|nr:hypothetical protein Ahy_B08g093831 [Arachis hypogaea]
MDNEIEVPAHFLCPISLQLMRDPVTVCSGITYDRENIEKWLFSCKNESCPVTKQSLIQHTDLDLILTPNHTLRRLIQSWCTVNASLGVERIPTPKPSMDASSHIAKLISEAKRFPETKENCLATLRSMAFFERNKSCFESSGAIEFLATIMMKNNNRAEEEERDLTEAAIEILFHLDLSENQIKKLINNECLQFLESLLQALKRGSCQSRAYATLLLKSAFAVSNPIQLISAKTEMLFEITRVIRDRISQQAHKAALKLVVELCPWGRNRIKAVEAGAVSVLVEVLLDSTERRTCELALMALDQLCGCAEGRAELVKHGAGIAVVSKKILRVSRAASDRGVRILASVCRFCGSGRVVQEMMQVGAVNKLCLVLQVDSALKTKERAKEILKLHSLIWKNSTYSKSVFLQNKGR